MADSSPQLYAYNEPFQGFSTPCYPEIPASVTSVTMVFALIGSGGNSSGGDVALNPPFPTATGGGGGVFIGSVVLPTNMQNQGQYYGTQLYAFVGQPGDQANSSTYISFNQQVFPQPQTGEPWGSNGTNGTYQTSGGGISGNGGSGAAFNPIVLVDGLITYPITQIFIGTGGNGQQGGIGTPGGASAYQAISNWPFISYPNTPTGQLQSAGNGGIVTGNPPAGLGDRGMVIVQYNYSNNNYSIYPPLSPLLNLGGPFYFLGTSDGQSADSSIVVPSILGNSDGTVTVTYILQGSGGNGATYVTEVCGTTSPNHSFTYGTGIEAGGSGGTLKGSFNVVPGTTIYIHVSATGDQQGTYITLIAPPGGVGPPTPPTVTGPDGQTQASPYVSGGSNAIPGSVIPFVTQQPGNGGLFAALNYMVSNTTSYPITTSINVNGKSGPYAGGCIINGPFPTTSPVYVPPDGFEGYLNGNTTAITIIPTNGYGGGYSASGSSAGSGGIIVLGFGIDIPYVASISLPDPPSRPIPCFPEGTRILTPLGYKPVETIQDGYLVTTSNHKQVPVKVYKRTLHSADKTTAPYFIPQYSLGSFPTADLRLSPLHAFRLQPDLWQIPEYASHLTKQIQQYGIGNPVTYYHLECPNYFRDHLLVDGCVVESYGRNQVDLRVPTYAYDSGRKGFVRTAKAKNEINTVHHRFSQ